MDDILIACIDIGLLHETKQLLSKTFDMKDLGDAHLFLGSRFARIDLVTY